jgi:hypothetical protein
MSTPAMEYLFVTSDYLVSIDGHVTAFSASTRLGCIAPMRALMHLGYDARTYSVAGETAPAEAAVRLAKRVVFGEMLATAEVWAGTAASYRRLLERIGNPRERVVFSVADDHFEDADFREFYARALPDCLAVTAVSERLAQTLRKFTSRPVRVAPEPVEGSRGRAQPIPARKLAPPLAWLARRIGLTADLWRVRLLWFGYPANLPPLVELFPALEAFSRDYPLLLTCVTNPVPEIGGLFSPERTHPDARFRLHFVPWTPFVLDEAISYSDVVLIPSDYRDPVKQAKSPNRLVAGLHGGRFVVAHPLPAYAPYAAFTWIGEDLCAGLEWAIRHPREVVERISRGQAYIDDKHSPQAVARFWLDVFHPKN